MIGNDVVDLNLAKIQSNWQRKGFLEKQFTQDEQFVILNSEDSFMQVWLFWSMKEAAYKCYTQEYQNRFFAPKKFSCKTLSNCIGVVEIAQEKYHIKYTLSKDYIYSVAAKEKEFKMVSDLFFINKNQEATKIIKDKIHASFPSDIELKKNEIGIPYLYQNNQKLPVAVSTSHHGDYAGFVFSAL